MAELEAKVLEILNFTYTHFADVTRDYNNSFYSEWAEFYEKEVSDINYSAPAKCAEYTHKHAQRLGFDKNCRILDVGAGTGLVGQELHRMDYTNLTAADPCEAMLCKAGEKNAYVKTVVCAAGDGNTMPFKNDYFDVVTLCSTMPYIKADGIMDIVRVVKPGGFFINTGRLGWHIEPDNKCEWFTKTIDDLKSAKAVEELEIKELDGENEPIYWGFENEGTMKDSCIVHVFKVL